MSRYSAELNRFLQNDRWVNDFSSIPSISTESDDLEYLYDKLVARARNNSDVNYRIRAGDQVVWRWIRRESPDPPPLNPQPSFPQQQPSGPQQERPSRRFRSRRS